MAVRNASAVWEGGLRDGSGTMSLGSGAFDGAYSFRSRFEEGDGTNPEELIGAAHAGCFSMALANGLAEAGHAPRRIETAARVHFRPDGEGPPIKLIELVTEGTVDGIDADEFARLADEAKAGCPVSQALAAVEITLDARLAGSS
jgi:osmotically inducible protein OsmC